jgi:hypothetical protein
MTSFHNLSWPSVLLLAKNLARLFIKVKRRAESEQFTVSCRAARDTDNWAARQRCPTGKKQKARNYSAPLDVLDFRITGL